MAKKKDKKIDQKGMALACWILGLLILIIVFFLKQDVIYSNLKTTNFFERLFGSTPQFIENHEVKIEPEPKEETIITIKTEEPVPSKEIEEIKPPVEEVKEKPKSEEIVQEKLQKKAEPAVKKPAEPKKEVKTVTVTNQKLYFVYIGEDGVVSRKVITKAVEKNDSPLMTNLKLLLAGPTSADTAKGYKTLIPSGTRLISASVRDGVAYLNFSEEFEFNSVGVDGYIGQLMQIVYTATEFSTVKAVQFLVDGQKKDYLGSEGVWIGSPLSRASF